MLDHSSQDPDSERGYISNAITTPTLTLRSIRSGTTIPRTLVQPGITFPLHFTWLSSTFGKDCIRQAQSLTPSPHDGRVGFMAYVQGCSFYQILSRRAGPPFAAHTASVTAGMATKAARVLRGPFNAHISGAAVQSVRIASLARSIRIGIFPFARTNNVRRHYATLTPSKAIVASEPSPNHRGGENWEMSDIRVPTELKDGELLVEMVATGICHTDISLTNPHMGQTFPVVPGHEGLLDFQVFEKPETF